MARTHLLILSKAITSIVAATAVTAATAQPTVVPVSDAAEKPIFFKSRKTPKRARKKALVFHRDLIKG